MSVNCDDPTEVENAAQAALIRKLAHALLVVRDALTAAREAGMVSRGGATEVKPLIDRLRNDGGSWVQPLFNEAADRIEDFERQLADANAHVAALTTALTTRRSACKKERERADEAERQLEAAQVLIARADDRLGALGDTPSHPVRRDLYTWTRAAPPFRRTAMG